MESQLENPGLELNSPPKRAVVDDVSHLFDFPSEENEQPHQEEVNNNGYFPKEEEVVEEIAEAEENPVRSEKDDAVAEAILKKRLNKIQREKYQAIDTARALAEENERLRREHQVSTEAAMKTYDNEVLQKLQNARKMKAEAIESGDVQAHVDADTELALAAAEYKNIENWKAQQALSQYGQQYHQQQQNTYHDYSAEVKNSNMKDWCLNNSYWADESSPRFDEALKYQAVRFADEIDRDLRESGQAHLIGTAQYLDTIERHLDMVKRQDYKRFYQQEVLPYMQPQGYSAPQRGLNMRSSGRPVAAVRGNYAPGSASHSETKLSKEHEEMRKKWRLPENVYKQYVKAYGKPNPRDGR